MRFDWFLSSLVGNLSGSVLDQMALGIYGTDEISDEKINLKGLLCSPGGAAWWNLYGKGFPRKFQQFVADNGLQLPPPAA